jgi:hypothetical protein
LLLPAVLGDAGCEAGGGGICDMGYLLSYLAGLVRADYRLIAAKTP